jgi:hypothetical protein
LIEIVLKGVPVTAEQTIMRPFSPCVAATLAALLASCVQTASFAPSAISARYSVGTLNRTTTKVTVNDLRAERGSSSVPLTTTLYATITNALSGSKSLTVDVIEHRSFFTIGNWHAVTRLKWRLDAGSNRIAEGESIGQGSRSNMFGYATASAVSKDAFNAAVADLMGDLSAIPERL